VLGGIIFAICFILFYWFVKKLTKFLKKKYIPKVATSFKCLDGHIVRSKGELIIDNHLHRLGIDHKYEHTIKIRGMPLKYDWYLPKYKTYIEYWGYYGKNYMKRKDEKLKLYRKGKLNLISIEDIMLKDIYSNLEKELKRFIKKDKNVSDKKHCPNCGIELDNRI
jgi:predicted nuclease of restriction endonuclease-like RecB superfamily